MNYRKYFGFTLLITIILLTTTGCFLQSEKGRIPNGIYELFYELDYQKYFNFYDRNFNISVQRDIGLPGYYRLGDRQLLKRPVMVAVENHPKSRPQAGLGKADLVYEVLAEGGITRFLPVYYTELPEKIGPVRSVRDYIGDLSAEHGALLLHAGASPGGYARISAEDVLHLDEISRSQYYWRSSARSMPHNLYTGYERIIDYIEDLDWQRDLSAYKFDFNAGNNPVARENKELIDQIKLFYWGNYQVSYIYDQSTDRYNRYINDRAHLTESGEQLSTENIVVIHADTNVIDDVGRLSVDLDSGGRGYLFYNGKRQEILWARTNGRISFFDEDNQEILIKPGRTWIQIMPESARVEFD